MQEQAYIYPPRATTSVPREQSYEWQQQNWIAQLKYNDTRCCIKLKSDGRIELWNRHAARINYNIPTYLQDQLDQLRQTMPGYTLLDGGLIHDRHAAIKDTIVIWDIIILQSKYQTQPTYQQRYDKLQALTKQPYYHNNIQIAQCITDNIIIPINYTQFETAWSIVDQVNKPYDTPLLEGVMIKNPLSQLRRATKPINNSEWQVRSRVTTGRHLF